MSRRGAIYARVSTARQEQEQTIESQVAAVERAAAELSIDVPPDMRFIDDGFSGARLDRPGLDALRDAAADGLIDVALIYCPDRLARNYVHQQVIVEELNKRGVELHFVERPIGQRAEDRLLMQMQGVIAEYERAKITERTRRGKLHRVRSGQMLPFTIAPYGYAIVRSPEAPRGVLVIDEIEAEHVRAMYRWVLEDGMSVWQVTKKLNALRVPPRRKKFWVQASVYRILTNSVYAGTAYFGKRETIEPKRPRKPGGYRKIQKSSVRVRPQSQWIEVQTPAIVDEKIHLAVRAQFERNQWSARRNTQHEYLLRTLVVCGQCSHRMGAIRQVSGNRRYEYFYYACMVRDRIMTGTEERCTSKRVPARTLDDIVWDAITSWIQSPEMLLRELDAWRVARTAKKDHEREQARAQKLERQLALQVERLIDAYPRGAISIDELKVRRERLETELERVRLRIQGLAAHEIHKARLDQIGEDLREFASKLRVGLDDLDFPGRQRIVQLLVERVVVTGDKIAIEHAIPLAGRFSGLHPLH
jgi:site-specific DNA recombinase